MYITGETLPKMIGRDYFIPTFCTYAQEVLSVAKLDPRFSYPRLAEVHGAWQNDVSRVGTHEPKLEDGLDHFKQCGHLAYWLRRLSPVVECLDVSQNIQDSEGYPLTEDGVVFRKFLLGYMGEYLAFDFGFQIVKFYEMDQANPGQRADTLNLTDDYIRAACQFLKYKHVSPHALHLIYKSLFLKSEG